jgi:hypothetical protein
VWDCTQQESSLRALCLTEQQETRRRKYLEDTRVRMAAVQNPPRLLKSGGTDADPNIRQLQQHHLYPPPPPSNHQDPRKVIDIDEACGSVDGANRTRGTSRRYVSEVGP